VRARGRSLFFAVRSVRISSLCLRSLSVRLSVRLVVGSACCLLLSLVFALLTGALLSSCCYLVLRVCGLCVFSRLAALLSPFSPLACAVCSFVLVRLPCPSVYCVFLVTLRLYSAWCFDWPCLDSAIRCFPCVSFSLMLPVLVCIVTYVFYWYVLSFSCRAFLGLVVLLLSVLARHRVSSAFCLGALCVVHLVLLSRLSVLVCSCHVRRCLGAAYTKSRLRSVMPACLFACRHPVSFTGSLFSVLHRVHSHVSLSSFAVFLVYFASCCFIAVAFRLCFLFVCLVVFLVRLSRGPPFLLSFFVSVDISLSI